MYIGVFANDDEWRSRIVAAGNESGDHAWPWPLHRRYRALLDSRLADIRNTSGRSFGYPIIAAGFLERFVGDTTVGAHRHPLDGLPRRGARLSGARARAARASGS